MIVALLMVFELINYADRSVMALSAEYLMDDLNISEATYGLISSSFYFLFAITAIGVGFMANRFQLKWILLIMAIAWVVTQAPVFFIGGAGVLFFNRIFLGAAEGPGVSMANASAFTWFPPEKRGLPASLLSVGSSMSKVIAAPLLTLLIVAAGWRWGFLALAIAGVIWSIFWLILGGDGPFRVNHKPLPARLGSDGTDASTLRSTEKAARRTLFRKAVLNRTFIMMLLGTIPMYALITVILSWMPAYLESGLGFSRQNSGLMFALPSLAALILMVVTGTATDRLLVRGVSMRVARGIIPACALLLAGACVTLIPWAAGVHTSWAVGLIILGYGLGIAAMPISYAVAGTLATPSQRPSVLGLFVGLQSLAGLVAPWCTGMLVAAADTKVEGYNLAFTLLGLAILIGGVIFAIGTNPERDNIRSEDQPTD
ncbi:MFS transporter [Rhodococcus oxybenzonivorans]|uniref:MFS transporter n=1 Tax=Rhodococcus oxybenzonivorans TaxID=1990687 RepID=UPI002954B89E|nr:MFS transporter [Rhodococcus oxybenzonivorans]MDV7353741.1 MFS transporter [Rhodococcus oxybenzonivorans]